MPSMTGILAEKPKPRNTHRIFLFAWAFVKISYMESFKANFLIFLFIIILAGLGYWAVQGIKMSTGTLVVENQIEDVGPIVTTNPSEEQPPAPIQEEEPIKETPAPTQPQTPADDDASLIGDLQELIDAKILMKKGSRGTRVGTVQKFLIEYGVDMTADNDYGDTTVNAVKKFQKENGLSADGQAGSTTFQKMIDWLKSN